MNDAVTIETVDEIALGSARGGRIVALPLEVEIVRALTDIDLPTLLAPPPQGSKLPNLLQIRQSHHLLARCLAEGHSQEEASLITGYSPAYISSLKGDPAFAELMDYYGVQKEQIFTDAMLRLKTLGIDTLEELQARLVTDPSKFSNRELMELGELVFGKGGAGPQAKGASGGTAGGGVQVNVTFVGAKGAERPMVDVTPEVVKHGV